MNLLHVILTSYNRPFFVRRALDSLITQTDPRWHCHLMDDGSDEETLDTIGDFTDGRITLEVSTGQIDRSSTRYGILINSVLPALSSGIVGFLCDNVEYAPSLVADVLGFFENHPHAFSGYTHHARDAWTPDGKRLGDATWLNHWNVTPPAEIIGVALSGNVSGLLDHSQVFHRLPVALRWPEAPEYQSCGDGTYFNRLTAAHGPIYPIRPETALTTEHLFK